MKWNPNHIATNNKMYISLRKAKEINSLRMNVEAYLENNKGRGNKKETDWTAPKESSNKHNDEHQFL